MACPAALLAGLVVLGCGGGRSATTRVVPDRSEEEPALPDTSVPSAPCVSFETLDDVCRWWLPRLRLDVESEGDPGCGEGRLLLGEGSMELRALEASSEVDERTWYSLTVARVSGRWYVVLEDTVNDSAGSESRGMTLEAELLPGGVLLTRSTNFETSQSGGGHSRCWLVTFAHGAPRLRFAATTDSSSWSSWLDESDEEVSESALWSLPVEFVDADHVVTGPSELTTEGDPEGVPEDLPRREEVLPDCSSAPEACPLACLGPED